MKLIIAVFHSFTCSFIFLLSSPVLSVAASLLSMHVLHDPEKGMNK
jgi:heme/copper-type cytochrome/quinol oxidase subunit 1